MEILRVSLFVFCIFVSTKSVNSQFFHAPHRNCHFHRNHAKRHEFGNVKKDESDYRKRDEFDYDKVDEFISYEKRHDFENNHRRYAFENHRRRYNFETQQKRNDFENNPNKEYLEDKYPLEFDSFKVNLTDLYDLPMEICGYSESEDRLIGGKAADILAHPWMAMILFKKDSKYSYLCSGTVISNRYVMTAAHCLHFRNISRVRVRLGDYDVSKKFDCVESENNIKEKRCLPPGQSIDVEEIKMHPKYNYSTNIHDIALLRLKKKIDFSFVKPVCLPVMTPEKFESGIIAGWGVTENGNTSEVLREVKIPIVPYEECEKSYEEYTFTKPQNKYINFCGGDEKRTPCDGDSGSPFLVPRSVNNQLRYVQEGFSIFGSSECGAKPNVFVRIRFYLNWILKNVFE